MTTRCWCWGAGWDSTAGIILDVEAGRPIDLITFADVGGEKRFPDRKLGEEVGTYEFIPIFTEWLTARGQPAPLICVYQPRPETHARYQAAVVDIANRLQLRTLDDATLSRLARLYGNMTANDTLPGIAFGQKSCSVKWKLQAQEPHRIRQPALRSSWANGEKVEKCIGFDAAEDHRVKTGGTYAVGNFPICPEPGLPAFRDRYDVKYPLREQGITRPQCREIIRAAGLPVPPKSACFFCPAMRQIEIMRLAQVDHEFYLLALEMEKLYRGGEHFRGDTFCVVKGQHKQTKELEQLECFAVDKADARRQFRAHYQDTAQPYRYTLAVYPAVPGLGRSFAWQAVALS